MPKLWAGRTSGVTDSVADDFNSSIRFDCKMYKQDITGSMAHAAMLGAKGIISRQESEQLIDGLQGILDDLESGALEIDLSCEDIHMFVEQVLTARLGDVGRKLHTARSRNDQVALDLRMYLRGQIDEITELVKDVLKAIVDQAEENRGVIMPGYTHLQRAQPILFSHHLMAYAMMLLRDLDRLADCRKRMNLSPIGCCALAGTTYDTDRRFEAERLGFDGVVQNSIDGVSDRDFCLELMSCLSLLMMHQTRRRMCYLVSLSCSVRTSCRQDRILLRSLPFLLFLQTLRLLQEVQLMRLKEFFSLFPPLKIRGHATRHAITLYSVIHFGLYPTMYHLSR